MILKSQNQPLKPDLLVPHFTVSGEQKALIRSRKDFEDLFRTSEWVIRAELIVVQMINMFSGLKKRKKAFLSSSLVELYSTLTFSYLVFREELGLDGY